MWKNLNELSSKFYEKNKVQCSVTNGLMNELRNNSFRPLIFSRSNDARLCGYTFLRIKV